MEERENPIELSKEEFQKLGYLLIDKISNFLDSIDERPVTRGNFKKEYKELFEDVSFPENGKSPTELISKTADLLIHNSLLNGHPRFMGYITSSPAPLGALADLLASSINPNMGAYILSPVATEIEKQTIKWLAQLIGVSGDYGGILVSGGNMANFTAYAAARTAKAPEIKEFGVSKSNKDLTVYCSKATHTWIEKASILFGLGTTSIRWIPTTVSNKINIKVLEKTIKEDLENGFTPMMLIGTAGDVSTGAVDNLHDLSVISKKYDIWFHVDGAYGIPAAVIPSYKKIFKGITEADSIALDPHKWLYSPLEAGCILVKNPRHLLDTFSSHPEYYNFNKEGENLHNYYEYGFQNSRGFRALKVWLTLQHLGKSGYEKLIREDIELSKMLFELVKNHPETEPGSQNLSITTFRYKPQGFKKDNNHLNTLNKKLLDNIQAGGEAFLSNAIIDGNFYLRACIVNFRTSAKDIKELPDIIVREGRKVHSELIKLQDKIK
jgi:aromatic-L-amino-acid/L-tryptophan decarboxylase